MSLSKKWHTNLTEELDKYLLVKYPFNKTYLWGYEEGVEIDNNIISFRVPGATRGHIVVTEDFIIKEIVIYKDAYDSVWACYKPEVVEIIPKYIGTKIELPDYVYRAYMDEEHLFD